MVTNNIQWRKEQQTKQIDMQKFRGLLLANEEFFHTSISLLRKIFYMPGKYSTLQWAFFPASSHWAILEGEFCPFLHTLFSMTKNRVYVKTQYLAEHAVLKMTSILISQLSHNYC